MLTLSLSSRSSLSVAVFVLLRAALACSSSGAPQVTGAAKITGPSVGAIGSAALIATAAINDAGVAGAETTYVQFFTNPPGTACSALDASTTALAGSLSLPADPSTLHGGQFTFGQTPDVFLTLAAAPGADDASVPDGGEPGEADPLVAVSGTVSLTQASGTLSGTFDAQMVPGGDPGAATVHVTGTFKAPACLGVD